MAKALTTNKEIDDFIIKVIREARRHAKNVADIINPLSSAVIAKVNISIDKIEVFERNGKLARTCWVPINGNGYVFSYDYNMKKIQMKENNTRGRVRAQFDNTTQKDLIDSSAAAL